MIILFLGYGRWKHIDKDSYFAEILLFYSPQGNVVYHARIHAYIGHQNIHRTMLDLQYIETHTQECIQRLTDRGFLKASEHIYALLKANKDRKDAQYTCDKLAEQLKKKTKQMHGRRIGKN